jgi:molybdopterin converting factor subunit 1
MSENDGNNINVKILFFGAARDAVGAEEASFTTAAPASVLSVKKAVFARYETLSVFAKSLMVAVNREYATDETRIENLDEIAFLPPVSGG